MAAQGRFTPADLIRLTGGDADGFSFDQLMRLAHVAGDGLPRLRTELRLGFAAGDVAQVRTGPDGVPELLLACFGLTGPSGTMPWHLTARLLDDRRAGQEALHGFIDLLSERLAWLMHLGWRRAQPALSHEAGDKAAHLPLLALAGLGTVGMATRIAAGDAGLDPDGLACHAALLGLATRPAEGLERLLAGHFGQKVSVQQFHGGWVEIPPATRLRIGMDGGLGALPPIGQRRFEVQSRLGIRIGPVDLATLRRLTAAGEDAPLARARRLTRLYLGDGFDIAVRFLLDEPCLTGPSLGGMDGLGVSGWLGLADMPARREDTVFHWAQGPLPDGTGL
jgi:type VI secretion system protein ImpH